MRGQPDRSARPIAPAGTPARMTPAALVAAMHHYDELVRAMDSHALAGLFVRESGVWRVRRLETTPDPPPPSPE